MSNAVSLNKISFSHIIPRSALRGHPFIFFFLLMLSQGSFANADTTSGFDSGNTKQVRQDLFITAGEIKQKIDQKAPITLIDIRSREEFTQARIPGSLNIPMHFIRTKAFLKGNPVTIITDGYQFAQLEPECKRLQEQGFKVSILLGGLNTWKQSGLPLEGESWIKETFDTVSPEAFYLEKDFDHWVVVDASARKAEKEVIPTSVPFDPDGLFASFVLKGIAEKNREGEHYLVLITNSDGTEYQHITQLVSKAGLKSVFYLEGGNKAYEQYLQGVALSKEPREKRVQKIQKCPTCGG